MYLHGGGYCIGSLTSHRAMLTHLAAATEGRVLAVDYRLAPEHPFPAALDDAIAAYRFVAAGHDPRSIVLAGDSAGGGLTVATLMALRDAGDRLPAGGICLSPWADLSQSGATIHSNATIDPMVRADDLDRWADAYAGTTDPRRPELSPLFGDLTGLPPLHIEVGTAEVLLDDSRRLAARVRASGGEVTYFEGEDLVHVWHFFAGLVPEADEATRRCRGVRESPYRQLTACGHGNRRSQLRMSASIGVLNPCPPSCSLRVTSAPAARSRAAWSRLRGSGTFGSCRPASTSTSVPSAVARSRGRSSTSTTVPQHHSPAGRECSGVA